MPRSRRNPRVRRASLPILIAASAGALVAIVGDAGAITGATVSPTVLSASGQQFTITYSGKDTNPTTPNLIVQECIANDTKVGFDTEIDCSPLSLVNYSDPGAPSGTIVYGGDPNNPFAPFVGIDVNNGEWSVCDPGSGVTNYQSGFFRVADFPSDTADDFFIPFTCGIAPPTTSTTVVPPTTSTTVVPPTTSTTVVPPTTSTTVVPPTTSTTVVPPTTSTTVVPPTTSTTVVPPTTSTTSTTVVPPTTSTTSTTVVPPTTSTTVVPPTTSTTVVPPTTSTTVVPPTTSTTVVPPSGPTCGRQAVTILGTPNRDRLIGTDGADVIDGLGGDDLIVGLDGDDVICAGSGNDSVEGGAGNDTIHVGSGNDRIVGSSGRDELRGAEGIDTIVGGSGNDSLIGGPDADICVGGSGVDTFHGCETKTPVAVTASLSSFTSSPLLRAHFSPLVLALRL